MHATSVHHTLARSVRTTALRGTRSRAGLKWLAAALALVTAAWSERALAAPVNDDFVNATPIASASNFSVTGSSVDASKQVGEPSHAGQTGGHSVWWKWTAPLTGGLVVSTAFTPFDTLLGVYTGSAVDALTEVASNDNLGTNETNSQLAMAVTRGVTYFFAVDGKNGAAGTITLSSYTFDPVAPLFYATSPSASAFVGESVSISRGTSGSPVPEMVWQRRAAGSSAWETLNDGAEFSGTRSTQLVIVAAALGMTGDQFRCIATNFAGSATSPATTLFIAPAVAPQIYNAPAAVVVNYGETLALYPGVSGSPTLTYVWKKNGVVLSDSTSAAYFRQNCTGADAGQYTLTVTNAGGTATSTPMTVTVNAPVTPAILDLRTAITVEYGAYLSLSPTITGSQPITFEWKKDGVALTTGSGSSYVTISNATTANSGSYTLTASNAAGVTSATVDVTVNPPQVPLISGLPASRTVEAGASFSFYPSVTGSQPITYQWTKNGVTIAGATVPYLSVTTSTADDGGDYVLTATNAAGTIASAPVKVVVNAPFAPQIFNLPGTITANSADSVSFVPTVIGTEPITYQWKKDGVNLPNATSPYLTLYGITRAQSGSYTLTATNAVGSSTSTAVTLNVNAPLPPTIYSMPPGATLGYGDFLSVNPGITGTQPMTFVWKKNGVLLPGGSSSSYSKTSVTPADSGTYTLTATNEAGTTTSSPMVVNVNPAVAPKFTSIPTVTILGTGEVLSLSVPTLGTQPMTYQWSKDGVIIAGATSNYFSKNSASEADSGQYVMTATNVAGTLSTPTISVTVAAPQAPVVSNLPAAVARNFGEYLTFSPTYSGTQPMTYLWKKDGVAVSNGTGETLTLNNLTTAQNGLYTVTATNTVGSATSSGVLLTVSPAVAPRLSGMPSSLVVNTGDSLGIYVSTISGTQPITYVWKKEGVVLDGATSSSYSKSNVTVADGGQYTLTATNAAGTTVSPPILVTVNPALAPVISTAFNGVALNYGESLNLYPTITGTQPITYQWKKDGVAIGNATNSWLSVSYVTGEDSGTYTLTATNVAGATTSPPITVLVNAAILPSINAQPAGRIVTPGTAVRFTVSASGTAPLSYQWYFNGTAIPGASNSTLQIPSAQVATAGTYQVIVTNPAGNITSQDAVLTLTPPLGVVDVAIGNSQGSLLKSDGSIWLYGLAFLESAGPSRLATNVVGVATGERHTLFVKADGSLWAVGDNTAGQLGDGTVLYRSQPVQVVASGVIAAYAGRSHSLFLKADGTLWGMGGNNYGQLGDGTNFSQRTPVLIATNVATASAGYNHSLLVKSDGTAWATGSNSSGELGSGTSLDRSTPVQVAADVTAVAAGNSFSLFIKSDHALWATGANGSGQLGDGTSTSRTTPIQVSTGVLAASAGNFHTLLVKTDGTLWAVGDNGAGQLGNGTYTPQSTPIQVSTEVITARAGSGVSFYVANTGAKWAMGTNISGQFGDNTTLSSFIPVLATSGPVTVPAAPQALTASDATQLGVVQLNWSPSLGTTRYEVWRSTASNPASAVRVADAVVACLYYDHTALAGTTYYYWVKAINPAGASGLSNPDSGSAAIFGAPIFIVHPQTRFAVVGFAFTFTAAADGTPAPSYQWRKNGVAIPGATGSSYTIPIVTLNDAGTYTVIATNTVASAVSNPAVLTPINPATAADFNGDGKPDLLWSNSITGERAIWLMNGTNLLSISTVGIFPLEWTIAATADFNGDGQTDLIWSNSITGERAIWLMNGTTLLSISTLGIFPLEWTVAATADFNTDGEPDLIWSNSITGERAIWLMNGTTFMGASTLGTFPLEWTVAATADFNTDGKPDIVWSNSVTGERAIWLMNGTNFLGASTLGIFPLEWTVRGTADFNADGKPDIIWSNSITGERALWLMNGTAFLGASSLGIFPLEWTVNN